MKTLLILILLVNTAFAQNSTYLKSGETAPFDGHLVKSERLEQLIKSDKQKPLLEAKFEAQNELIDYHKGNAKEARSKLLETELKGNLKLIGGFLLGVVITGFAFKVNKEITR